MPSEAYFRMGSRCRHQHNRVARCERLLGLAYRVVSQQAAVVATQSALVLLFWPYFVFYQPFKLFHTLNWTLDPHREWWVGYFHRCIRSWLFLTELRILSMLTSINPPTCSFPLALWSDITTSEVAASI
jgi:hypothetical protein